MPTHGAYTSSLEQEGLITTVGPRRGRIVRVPPRRAVRSSERHQLEKDRAILPLPERAEIGEAETNLDMSIGEQMFTAAYDTISASEDLARVLQVRAGDPLLRRTFVSTDPRTGLLLSSSVSYIPRAFVEGNPALLDEKNEPWPGGTLHQLSTVGIEIMLVADHVTARMPTSAEAEAWDLPPGVPLLLCRRISVDARRPHHRDLRRRVPCGPDRAALHHPAEPVAQTTRSTRMTSLGQADQDFLPARDHHLPPRPGR